LICERPGCNHEVPYGRRKYCSDACGRSTNRNKAAAVALAVRLNVENENFDVKVRRCLCCGTPFQSDGPWNRICSRCKRRGGH
jgi:predicted nucleic acid-binding Zn ribbon protein